MADWTREIDWTEVVHVTLARFSVEGWPSAVTRTVLELRHRDGSTSLVEAEFDYVAFETLQALIADVNRELRRRG